jgi:hypothetical protein
MDLDATPRQLQEHRAALQRFTTAYVEYLNLTGGAGPPPGDAAAARARQAVFESIPAAEAALEETDYNPALLPPPLMGGAAPILQGLSNLAFIHETPDGRVAGQRGVPGTLLDAVVAADAELAAKEQKVWGRRRNPLYWCDRLLRIVLGIPVYLLSLVFGVPVQEARASTWGRAVRVLELPITALAVVMSGFQLGWW